MQRFHHLGGMAAIALTALGLSACYPPRPATVAPPGMATELPPRPPPYVPPPTATTPPYSPSGVAQAYGPTALPGAAIPSNAGTPLVSVAPFLVSVAPFAPPPPRVETPHRRPRWRFGNRATGPGAADSMSGFPGNMCSGPHQLRTGCLATGNKGRTAGSGPKAAGRREAAQPSSGCALCTQMTALGGVRPARTASIPSNARKPIASRVSTVALPRWGSRTTFCSPR